MTDTATPSPALHLLGISRLVPGAEHLIFSTLPLALTELEALAGS